MKSALRIPVIGNGGIESLADGDRYCSSLDGFTLVKPRLTNPWFSGQKPERFIDRLPVILNHAKYLIEHKGDRQVGTREIRKHLLAYVKGVWEQSHIRNTCLRWSHTIKLNKYCNCMKWVTTC